MCILMGETDREGRQPEAMGFCLHPIARAAVHWQPEDSSDTLVLYSADLQSRTSNGLVIGYEVSFSPR